ncbi:response regulator [Ferruginibacter paludis]|uniref:response regulator n=1 Tax=Ferruginibacter paludis TaxID=1310417 RepID=UPI0025B4C976|nr:response regulator [Ferruginibacter paludis]MDN3656007.1 response regulator [Ferruginibacter paludis]
MKVLIVDSSIDIIERLEEMLSETTIASTVYTAITYDEAIHLYITHQPDAVFLDEGLPGNHSIQLLAAFKQLKKDTTVIMISIIEDADKEEKCRLLGADFFCDLYHHYQEIPQIMYSIVDSRLKRPY